MRFLLRALLCVSFALAAGCAPSTYLLPSKEDLAALIAERSPAAKGDQHFCVVPYGSSSRDRYAWVHWQEGRAILLWEGGPIARSRRALDLDKDVVATEAEIGGSTYLVTRAWVEDTLRECQAFGVRYTIRSR